MCNKYLRPKIIMSCSIRNVFLCLSNFQIVFDLFILRISDNIVYYNIALCISSEEFDLYFEQNLFKVEP